MSDRYEWRNNVMVGVMYNLFDHKLKGVIAVIYSNQRSVCIALYRDGKYKYSARYDYPEGTTLQEIKDDILFALDDWSD